MLKPRPCAIPKSTSTTLNLRDIAEVWRRGSVIASWLLDLTAGALLQDPKSLEICRARVRFRGRSLDDQSGDRRSGARAGSDYGSLRAIQFARRGGFRQQTVVGNAVSIRRTPGKIRRQVQGGLREMTVNNSHSDAFVFFGATGDLAYKKIFPALQAMIKRGHLNVPVIGVAKAGWNLEQLKARAHDSLEKHGGVDPAAFEKLSSLLRYVDGDYQDPETFKALGRELNTAQRPAHYLAIPPTMFEDRARTTDEIAAARPTPASSSRSRSVTIWNPPGI